MTDTSTQDIVMAGKITAWLERQRHGQVLSIVKQDRWRPAWHVTVRKSGQTHKLYVRCDRGAGLETRPLKTEYAVLKLLQDHGIPVPGIVGWCEDPEAIVMADMDDRPYLGGADTDAALHGLVEEYVAIMARVHRIPVTEAAALGLALPDTPEQIAFDWFRESERVYRAGKTTAEPLIEFVRKYLRRTTPLHRQQRALLIGDAPQFFHDGNRVTAIYDLELAHIGDPMADLASLRVRDINEPTGGMTTLIRRYALESGMAIDWPALDFHTIASFISVPMRVDPTFRTIHPHPAFIEYLSWSWGTSRAALEIIAEAMGLELETVGSLPRRPSRGADALTDLVALCSRLPAPTGLMREAATLSLANFARRLDEMGGALDRIELEEVRLLLGTDVATLTEGEECLERFVLEAGPAQDAHLVRFFHRRIRRRLQLLQDYPGPIVTRGPTPVDRGSVPQASNRC
jgi:aminoglycoside phosphotransferase (APT) family kinase protein